MAVKNPRFCTIFDTVTFVLQNCSYLLENLKLLICYPVMTAPAPEIF